MGAEAIKETNFTGLGKPKRGKVRDIYDFGSSLLMVATDRISAFDIVLPDPIPDKGKVLNLTSLFWFDLTRHIVQNHIIARDIEDFPKVCDPYADELRNRSVLVWKTKPLLIECVVRGYITGSGWKDYQGTGAVCGIKLPKGLKESEKLPKPIFTPSTKEEGGKHDININFKDACNLVGKYTAEEVKRLSLEIYNYGSELAEKNGIIIADTKFEFGLINGHIILIDEVLTPDSSRFWPQKDYKPGGPQKSFDKQYVRDYLVSIGWNKKPQAPKLPTDVIKATQKKYISALKQLAGITI
ncbi:phosphoribosylaminoimidazolesuccinocarboxamide synthase [Candidatus Parcubacteria bacterium]|nr:phosphoribosylaminoimidazolesuccinocarboxamide synthase [Candidatus Parcubacteria bacterium]